jgi:large subunit ribosomal protein L21
MTDQYAIVKSGSKQYRVQAGDVIKVDLLHVEDGTEVDFKDVFFLSENGEYKVGLPVVEGCVVKGEVVCETKGPKVISFKFKRRQNCHRKIGHRQRYTEVKILEIINNVS